MDAKFEAALMCVGFFWLIWAGGCCHSIRWRTFDPIEAKSKAVMTATFSLAMFAFWIHWSVAVILFIAGIVMYFWAQAYLRGREFWPKTPSAFYARLKNFFRQVLASLLIVIVIVVVSLFVLFVFIVPRM